MGYMSTMAMPGMHLKQLLTSSNNNIFPYIIDIDESEERFYIYSSILMIRKKST